MTNQETERVLKALKSALEINGGKDADSMEQETITPVKPEVNALLQLQGQQLQQNHEDDILQQSNPEIQSRNPVNTNNLYLFWYKHELNSFPKFMLGRFSLGMTAYEGEDLSLNCTYNTSLSAPSLFWYIQSTNDYPEYVLWKDVIGQGDFVDKFKDSITKSVSLTIQRVQLSDSAVYYCALRSTMEKSISVLIILIMATGMVSGDSVTPDKEEFTPTEGSSVTMSCTYETSSDYVDLYWYRHYSNQAPQFLLYKGARSRTNEHIPDKRFASKTSHTSTELVITRLTLADTALYYCALWDYTHKCQHHVYAEKGYVFTWGKCYWVKGEKVTAKLVPLTIQRLQLSDSAMYYCALKPTCTGDNVQQQPGGVIATEGGLVILSCQYNTTSANNNVYLYWYKQEANDFPKHILTRYYSGSGDNAEGFMERFNASLNTKTQSVPLTIQRLQLFDSAVYYCALRPTWYLQDPGSAPIFLLLTGVSSNRSVVKAPPPYRQLSVKLNDERTLVDLEISSAEVTDSQIYLIVVRKAIKKKQHVFPFLTGVSFEYDINPTRSIVGGVEGDTIKLSCSYTDSVDNLQWYHQYPKSKPTQVHTDREDLEISSAEVTDSALYYCAVKSTNKHEHNVNTYVVAADSMEQETITPVKPEVNVLQGTDITLSCNYKGNVNYLQWYRQYHGSRPECLLLYRIHPLRLHDTLVDSMKRDSCGFEDPLC
ncbi:unnamed protein product [Coregonus sp. 'balchen']|nr:unnamed protein product [Coregonus sp. 'balchen']